MQGIDNYRAHLSASAILCQQLIVDANLKPCKYPSPSLRGKQLFGLGR